VKLQINFAIACLTLSIFSSSFLHAWELEKSEDGIDIYTETREGSDFKAFKGTAILNADIEQVLSVLGQAEGMKNWLHECEESTVLKQHNENEASVYQRTHAPWPVSDRDYIIKTKIERFPEAKRARMSFVAIVEPETKEGDECVRVTQLEGHWNLFQQTQDTVFAEYETFADPAGDIPSWLANAFVVDQPYYTIKNLRELVEDQ
jgi:hypothetical protein